MLLASACCVPAFAAWAGERGAPAEQTIVVPVRAIYPGDELDGGNVEVRSLSDFPRSGTAAGYAKSPGDIAGKVARRTLLSGQPIPMNALRGKAVVVQGRTYAMQYRSANLLITGTGVPLQSGALGELINVRNPDTGIVVKARVGDGQVLIVEGL